MAFDLFTPGHASSSSRPARASSSHAPASTTNGHKDSAAEDDGNDEDDIEVAYLRPQAYGNGDKAAWRKTGKSFGIAVSPTGGEVAAWVTKEVSTQSRLAFNLAAGGDASLQHRASQKGQRAAINPTRLYILHLQARSISRSWTSSRKRSLHSQHFSG